MNPTFIFGYGSQGRAWAGNLRDSGLAPHLVLSSAKSPSWHPARQDDFSPLSIDEAVTALAAAGEATVILLIPDDRIGALYREHLAALPCALTLVLAHGFAVYAGDLVPSRPNHRVALLAPKAIGPELRQAFLDAKGETHDLAAAVTPLGDFPALAALARGLGFAAENLIETTADMEARADLISEQGLLCGGLFTLIDWTMERMRRAGVPERLIREECLTELSLIARLLRRKGLSQTINAISPAAAAGAGIMNQALEGSGARGVFETVLERAANGRFADDYSGGAGNAALRNLKERFKAHDLALQGKNAP